jgi:phosphoribosyl 1,2-cyclic phosphate phosphodiesterase
MDLLLLGTAAADGWPAPYCDCKACSEARRRGGPNIRSRSGALIDDDLKIDHNPDTVMQMHRERRSLGRLKTILFTHDHHDHIFSTDLKRSAPPNTTTRPNEPIAVYGNNRVLAEIRRMFPEPMKINLDLRLMTPFESFTTPTGDTVLPVPAAHCPEALLLRITRSGKSIFYGHDSGKYPDATLDALAGTPLDVALFDCTHQMNPSNCEHHMNIPMVFKMIDALRSRGAVTERTRLVVTHFTHNGGIMHEEMVQMMLPHRIEVAYDGMTLRV